MRKKFNKWCVLIGLCNSLMLIPIFAWAASGETPISEGGQYWLDAMYGATGVTIATIAVTIVGLLCKFGRLGWMYFFGTISGICIVFGAPAIVTGVKSLITP